MASKIILIIFHRKYEKKDTLAIYLWIYLSVYQHKCIYCQLLNVKTLLFQTIQFNITTQFKCQNSPIFV